MNILIVDDEELIIEFLERALKLDGHTVTIGRNGLEAFDKASQSPFDIIILDVIMPIKNGLEVCRDLRQIGVRTPIIILTSRDGESARIEGLDAGANDYLTKPFSYAELSTRLELLRDTPDKDTTGIVTVNMLTLDKSKRIISNAGAALDLKPREYSVLAHLMEHVGKIISKDEIFKSAWPSPIGDTSDRVDACINHINEKLADKNGTTVIKAVKEYGYVLQK